MSVDLRVSVGSLQFQNPIIAASGTFGYGAEFAPILDLNRLGGFVVKGLSIEPMEGATPPRLVETASGMLNAVGLQNVGVRAFVEEKLPALRGLKAHVIANVFGYRVEDYVQVIEVLERAEGLAAYELNISCPNTVKGGHFFGCSPSVTTDVVSEARKAARNRPLWVKLSPNVTDITETARAAEAAGADALTVANTYIGMAIDYRTQRSRLGRNTGGLSGPAIKPLTLRLVCECFRDVRIPILGLGGIEKAEDILEYMVVGATAVQVGTAHFVDPRASIRLLEGLEKVCLHDNIHKINDLRGNFKPFVD